MISHVPKLSFGGLSPFWPIPNDHLIMVLKSYFDGANKADLKQFDRVVLAAALGTSEQWDAFQEDWKKTLDQHNVPFLHTTDALTLNGPFSLKDGWTDNSVDNVILNCVRVIKRHIAMPSLVPGEFRPGLRVVTMTIYLEDYKKAREKKPEMPNSVNEICTSEMLGFVFRWGRKAGAEWYHLYFDRNEDFYGHVRDRKDNKKIRKDIPMLEKVAVLAEAEMQLTPGLQLADLFAWCISHNDIPSKRLWHRALNDLPIDPSWESVYMDESYLLNPTPGALERTQAWGMPQRRLKPE
jgi:hypothetical protein